jgi:hypothetical protein
MMGRGDRAYHVHAGVAQREGIHVGLDATESVIGRAWSQAQVVGDVHGDHPATGVEKQAAGPAVVGAELRHHCSRRERVRVQHGLHLPAAVKGMAEAGVRGGFVLREAARVEPSKQDAQARGGLAGFAVQVRQRATLPVDHGMRIGEEVRHVVLDAIALPAAPTPHPRRLERQRAAAAEAAQERQCPTPQDRTLTEPFSA